MWMFGWGMGLTMLFGWLLPLAAVALIIWLLVGRGRGDPRLGPTIGQAREDTALQTLRERYARGEISREEFLQARDDLWQSGAENGSTKG